MSFQKGIQVEQKTSL